MKTRIIYFLFFILFITSIECGHSQSISEDQQAIEMIKEFYTEYFKVWEYTPTSIPADVLHEKLDSIVRKYCTNKIGNEANKLFAIGHDLMTKSYGIDSLGIKTLSIKNDSTKQNVYVVSYTILDDVVPNISKKEVNVFIHVTIQKENGILKIDDIE